MSIEEKINKTVEDIIEEIENNISVGGDDTWGAYAECDKEYLREYITNKIKELLKKKIYREMNNG